MKAPLRPVGLDVSSTAIGVARVDGATVTIRPTAGTDDRARRHFEMITQLGPHLSGATIAMIEGYVPNGRGDGAGGYETMRKLAEIGGVVRLVLFEHGIRYVDSVKPSQLKKYATGTSKASKLDMIVAANAHGAGIDPGRHDEADAWWLRRIVLDRVDGVVPSAIPEWDRYRADLIAGVEWP